MSYDGPLPSFERKKTYICVFVLQKWSRCRCLPFMFVALLGGNLTTRGDSLPKTRLGPRERAEEEVVWTAP